VTLNPAALPYREDVLNYVRNQREQGREVILATAADESIATAVADHLGVFDRVLASDGRVNLSSSNKLQAIQSTCDGPFDYIGNSHDDLKLWARARQSFAVAPSSGVLRSMKGVCSPQKLFDAEGSSTSRHLRAVVKALRPHQW